MVTKWNSTFLSVTAELGVGVELCWPYQPQQKGSVENLVGWVKGSFFKQRRFIDDEDLRRQLEAWHREVNTERPSRATREVPSVRLKRDEAACLRPVRINSAALELRIPVHVGPQWMRDVNILHEMLSMHGDAQLRTAVSKAATEGTWGAEYVAHHLRESRAVQMAFDGEGVTQ